MRTEYLLIQTERLALTPSPALPQNTLTPSDNLHINTAVDTQNFTRLFSLARRSIHAAA